jgi:hypothetical protein
LNNRAREDSRLDALDGPVASDPGRRASGVQARAQPSPPSSALAAAHQPLPLISIGSPADPALLEPTYAYLSSYTAAYFPQRVAERLNVAIYELYANALRYGSGNGEVRLQLERSSSGVGARLTIANRAEAAQVAKLSAQVARVLEDAGSAFASEMDRFAGGSHTPPMLGLVRIAHESALLIDLVTEGDRVEVTIVCEP